MTFCGNCGKEMDSGWTFCRNCGNPVAAHPLTSSSLTSPDSDYIEKFLVFVPKISGAGYWNLYVTDSRFVLLKTQSSGTVLGEAIGGGVGAIAVYAIQRARKKSYDDNLSLNELLNQDKHNFAITFDRVSSITPRKNFLGRSLKHSVTIRWVDEKGKSKNVNFIFRTLGHLGHRDHTQIEKFKELLPSLRGLLGKYNGFRLA